VGHRSLYSLGSSRNTCNLSMSLLRRAYTSREVRRPVVNHEIYDLRVKMMKYECECEPSQESTPPFESLVSGKITEKNLNVVILQLQQDGKSL
jgi:hypothetical protein